MADTCSACQEKDAQLAALTEEHERLREYVIEHQAAFRGPLPLRSLVQKVRSYRWIQRMVNGALQNALTAHGAVDNTNLSSASKRVASTISAELRQLFTNENFADLIIRLRRAEKKGGDAMNQAGELAAALAGLLAWIRPTLSQQVEAEVETAIEMLDEYHAALAEAE